MAVFGPRVQICSMHRADLMQFELKHPQGQHPYLCKAGYSREKERMSCGICGITFSEDSCDDVHQPKAKILACLHIICTDCLAPLIQVFPDEKAIVTVCPLCSTPTVKSLPSEFVHESCENTENKTENNTLSRCSSEDSDLSVSKIDTTPTQYYPSQVETKQDGLCGEQNLDTSVYSDLPDELLDMYNETDDAPSYEEIYFQKEHIDDSSELDRDSDTYSEDHHSQSVHSETAESTSRDSVVHRNSELVALAHWTLVFIDFMIILSVCIYRFVGESIFADNSVIQIRASAETQTMVCALLLTHLLLQEMPSASLFTGYHRLAEESAVAAEGDHIINTLLVVADVAAVVSLLFAAVGSTVRLVCQIIAQEFLAYLQLPSLSTADVVMAASAIALISSAIFHTLFETSPPESTYSPRKAKRSSTPSATPSATPASATAATPGPTSVPKNPKNPVQNTPNTVRATSDVRYSSPEPRKGLSVNSTAASTTGAYAYTNVSPKLTPMDNPLRKASIRLPARARSFAAASASADVEYADIYGTSTSQPNRVRSASPSLEELLHQAVLDDFTAQEEAQQLAEQEAQRAAALAALLVEHTAMQEAARRAAQREEQQAALLAAALATAQATAEAQRQAEERAARQRAEEARAELERAELERAEEERAVRLASERLAEQLARSARPAVLSPPRSIHRADRHTPTDSEEHGMNAARLVSPLKPTPEPSKGTIESSWNEAPVRVASPVPSESAASRLFVRVYVDPSLSVTGSAAMETVVPAVSPTLEEVPAADAADSAVFEDGAEDGEVAPESPPSAGVARPAVATHVPRVAYSPLQSFPQSAITSMALSPVAKQQDDEALSPTAPTTESFSPAITITAVANDHVCDTDMRITESASTQAPAAASVDPEFDPRVKSMQRQLGGTLSVAADGYFDLRDSVADLTASVVNIEISTDASIDTEFDPRVTSLQRQMGGALLVAADSFFDQRDSAVADRQAAAQARDLELIVQLDESPLPSLGVVSETDAEGLHERSEVGLVSDLPTAAVEDQATLTSAAGNVVAEEFQPVTEVPSAVVTVEVENVGFDPTQEPIQPLESPSRSKFHVINASKRKKGLRKFKSMYAYSPPTSSPTKPSQLTATPPASANKLIGKGKSGDKSMSKSWSETAPEVYSASGIAGGALKRHNSTQSVVSKDGSLGTISSYSTMGGSSLNSSYNNINSMYAGAPTSAQKMMSKSAAAMDGNESVAGSVASGGSQSKRSTSSPQTVRAARQAAADCTTPKSKPPSATKLTTPPVSLPKPELRSPSSFAYLTIYELKKHLPNDISSAKSTPNRPAKKALRAQAELDNSALEASVDLVECMRTRSVEEASVSGMLFTGAEGRAVLPAPRRENGNRVAARRYSDDDDSESSDTSGGSSAAEDSETEEAVVRAPSRGRGGAGAATGVENASVGHGASRPHGLQQVVPEPISFMPQPLPSPDLFHRETRDSGLASWIALQSYTEPPSPAFTSATHNDFPDSSTVLSGLLRTGNSDGSLKAAAANATSATVLKFQELSGTAQDTLGAVSSEVEAVKGGVASETSNYALDGLPMEYENTADSPSPTESAISASAGAALEVAELPTVSADEPTELPVIPQPGTATFVRSVPPAGVSSEEVKTAQLDPLSSTGDQQVDSTVVDSLVAAVVVSEYAEDFVPDNCEPRAESSVKLGTDVSDPPASAEHIRGKQEQIIDEAVPTNKQRIPPDGPCGSGLELPEQVPPSLVADEALLSASVTAAGTADTLPPPCEDESEVAAKTTDGTVDDQTCAQEGSTLADNSALPLEPTLSETPAEDSPAQDDLVLQVNGAATEYSVIAETPQYLSMGADLPVSDDTTSVLHGASAAPLSTGGRPPVNVPAASSASLTDDHDAQQAMEVSSTLGKHFEDVYDEVQHDLPHELVEITEQHVADSAAVHDPGADERIDVYNTTSVADIAPEALQIVAEIPNSVLAIPTAVPVDSVEKSPFPTPAPSAKHHVAADIDTALANEPCTEAPSPIESPDTMVTTYRDDLDAPETPGNHRMHIDVSISPDAMSQITAPSPAPLSILSLSQLAAPTPSPLKQSPLYMTLPISPYNDATESSNGPPSRGSASNASFTAGFTSGSRSKSNIRASIEERVYARMRRNSMNNLLPGSANSREGPRSAEPSPSIAQINPEKMAVALNTPEEVDRFEHEMHALYRDYLPESGATSVQRDNVPASVGSGRASSQGRLSVSPLDPSSRQISPKPAVEMVTTGTSPIRVLQKQIESAKQETIAALPLAVAPSEAPTVAPAVAPVSAPAVLDIQEETQDDAIEGASLYLRSNSVASLTAMRTASIASNQGSVLAAITAEVGGETTSSPTRSPDRPKAALHRGSTVATMSSPGRATTVRPGSMFLKNPDTASLSTSNTPTKHSAVPGVISKVTVSAGIGKGKVSPVPAGSVAGSVTPTSMKRSSTAASGSSTVMAMRSVGIVGSVGTTGSAQSVSSTVSGTPKSLSRAASSLDCVADTMDTSSCYVVMIHMNQQLTSHRCVGKIAKCISSVVSKCQQRQCPVAVAISTPHSPPNVLYWLYAVQNTRTSASVSSLAAAYQNPVSPLSASGGSVGSASSPDGRDGPGVEYVIKAKNKPCFLLPKRGDGVADIQLTERMYRGAVSGLVSQESSALTHLHSHHVDGDVKAGFEEHLLNLRAEIKLALGAFTGTTDVVVVCDSQSWPFYAPPELATVSNALTKWSTFRTKVPYLQFHFVAINTLSSSASTASLLSGK